ncbi:SRPBCC family protein [Dyadobacter aurulentus]|uniref:SRPBCC family protein n=1 Tax=Dyadobacter sp. UC 10 TaxID=2605428 RepID=UPI0011F16D1D|nr:SRPBCC domain-containing protein [Dyadobacter sp. UC 10]KAA0993020.1 SRPBCC domain-containing protein [Dyadobacter sp. UC 10]
METKRIEEAILINAPAEKIWQVITEDKYNRDWLIEFGAGNIADTDWHEGSKALFMDESKSGMAGVIEESRPFEKITVAYTGIVTDGEEDYESEMAQQMNGYREVYILEEKGDAVRLSISCDMDKEYYDDMAAAWRKALEKMKELSENL